MIHQSLNSQYRPRYLNLPVSGNSMSHVRYRNGEYLRFSIELIWV